MIHLAFGAGNGVEQAKLVHLGQPCVQLDGGVVVKGGLGGQATTSVVVVDDVHARTGEPVLNEPRLQDHDERLVGHASGLDGQRRLLQLLKGSRGAIGIKASGDEVIAVVVHDAGRQVGCAGLQDAVNGVEVAHGLVELAKVVVIGFGAGLSGNNDTGVGHELGLGVFKHDQATKVPGGDGGVELALDLFVPHALVLHADHNLVLAGVVLRHQLLHGQQGLTGKGLPHDHLNGAGGISQGPYRAISGVDAAATAFVRTAAAGDGGECHHRHKCQEPFHAVPPCSEFLW